MHKLPIVVQDPQSETQQMRAVALSEKWGLPQVAGVIEGLVLEVDDHKLALLQRDEPKLGAVFVDFASDALTFRRLHGGGRKESIAKAIGIKGDYVPDVLDATAGLGRDAFVLAALGCRVDMIERSPVVAALLQDGLDRAARHPELVSWLPEKMQLFHGVSYDLLKQWQNRRPQVIYLDPMFPHRKKSALVKKEMRLFQQLLGPDEDADALLPAALELASKRVVVKRPDAAPHLNDTQPNMVIASKKHRFDVYLTDL